MKPTKRLLITTDCFLPRWDGVARFLSTTIPYLKKHFIVRALVPNFGKTTSNVLIRKFAVMPFHFGDIQFSFPHLICIWKEVSKHDVVFNNTLGPIGMCAILCARMQHKPVISFVHSIEWDLAAEGFGGAKWFVRPLVRSLAKFFYQQCSLLLVPSNEVANTLRRANITTPFTVVGLGVDTRMFIPPKTKRAAKKKLGIDPNAIVIGYHGRLGREKDLQTLVSAWKNLCKKTDSAHHSPLLLIVGAQIDETIPKERSVLTPGSVNNVVPYVQAMDIFVLCSLTETTSLATLEAMACEVPVVVTPVGKIKEYIKDGQNGLLFESKNADVLTAKLWELIHEPESRELLGKNGRATVLRSYRSVVQYKELVNAIKKTK